MHVLLPILLAVVALGLVAMSQQARLGRLHRMESLVTIGHKQPAAAAAEPVLVAERFLPRSVVRNLHLLGIEPEVRGASIALAAAGSLVGVVAYFAGLLPALALASTTLLAGLMLLNILASRRLTELGALLPNFFDRVRQLLTIGNSLPTAFIRSVQSAPPLLAAFFAPAVRRMGNGASFSASIAQSAEDIDLYEMRLFAAAVATNMRFGGSLTHSLGNLVTYLRKRASIEREMRANTTQIRVSAWVLGLLPMLVAGLIIFQNQDYARWFISHPTGKRMLVYCIISQIIGALLMRMVVRTKF
jgi:tight adherence protein B